MKTPVSDSLTRVSAIVTSDYVDGNMKLTFRYNLADTLEDVRPKTLPDTLEDVKAEALIYGPTNTLPEEGFRNVFACLRKDSTHLRLRKHLFTLTETYKKVIRFR